MIHRVLALLESTWEGEDLPAGRQAAGRAGRPDGIEAKARREEIRLQDNPATTGKPDDLPEAFAANGEGLPWKVFSLRQKLYHKAKR